MFSNKNANRLVLIGMLLCVGILVGGVSPVQAQTDYSTAPDCSTVSYNGSGTSSDPYQVDDPYELQCIGNQDLNSSYELTDSINLSVTENWNSGKGFDPVGTTTNPFTGTLAGNKNTISELYINRPTENYTGMFGSISNSGIDSLGLYNMNITGYSFVGGIAGESIESQVTESYTAGPVYANHTTAGGIIGTGLATTIKWSYHNGQVKGGIEKKGNYFGGIAGKLQENQEGTTSDVISLYATGNISGNIDQDIHRMGRLVGGNSGQIYVDNAYYDSNDKIIVNGTVETSSSLIGYEETTDQLTGSEVGDLTGFLGADPWKAVDSSNGYTADGYPILISVDNETKQLSAQSISTATYYDLTVNVDHNGTDVDTDYEILDDTDTVVASGTTGSDGQIVKNLEEGTYEVQLAYDDAEYRYRNETVTLDADKTLNHSLNKLSYNLTVDTTESGSSVNTTYVIINSDGNAVEQGHTGSDGTVTHEIQYDTYTITIADQYESTVAVDETERKYDNATRSITLGSDSTESFSLNISQYDLTINTTQSGSTAGVNVSYNVTQDGSEVVSGYTDGEVVETLDYGTYNISVAGGDTYVENTTEILHNQTDTLEFDLVEQGSDVVVTDSGNDGRSGLFALISSIGGFATGLVVLLTIGGIVFGLFRSRVM